MLLVLVLFASQSTDAAGCKYQHNETDKFTKVVTRWTEWNPIAPTWGFSRVRHTPYISIHSVDDEVVLLLKIDLLRQEKQAPDMDELENFLVVSEGAPLFITLADGTLLELPALEDVRAWTNTTWPGENDPESNLYVTTGSGTLKYPLDAADLEALAGQPASKVSVTTDNGSFDIEVHKKSVNDFMTATNCSLPD